MPFFQLHDITFFFKYVYTNSLDLSNNKLKSIPTELSRQENLKYLYCECNHLTSLSLSGLSNLRFVSLSHNRLTALNESFSELESVKYLDLSYNNIGADFDVLSKIKTLTVLDLSYNNITMTLPEFHR